MSQWRFETGRKPAWMSLEDWETMLKSPGCARLNNGSCSKPCEMREDGSYTCDIDHIVPRAAGGKNHISNYQWLCSCVNRWEKGPRPDAYWARSFWFDQAPVLDNLRDSQRHAAWDVVVEQYPAAFSAMDNNLLDVFLLMAWVVGSGKTIGVATAMMAINHVRRREYAHCKRIGRALFVVHQRNLVESIAAELEEEFTKFKIVDRAPKVLQIKEAADWPRVAGGDFDIAVACTQSLWDAEGRAMDEDRLASHLSKFDALAVDEAQFAPEQYARMLKLMPSAVKFALTATPFDREGNYFCDREAFGELAEIFALFSVYDYHRARNAGPKPALKELVEFDAGIKSGKYAAVSAGNSVELFRGEERPGSENSDCPDNFIREKAIVARAAAAIESDHTPFDGHLMVKAENIKRAQLLTDALNADNSGLPPSMYWRALVVYSGQPSPMISSPKHGWNRVKHSKDGRCSGNSARIVVTVDIGQFGLNNRYCSAICWVAENKSQIELVQRIGRALRYADGSAPVRLYWDAKFTGMMESMRNAVDYIRLMDEKISKAGFRGVDHAVEFGSKPVKDPIVDPRLTDTDRAILINRLGAKHISEPHGDPDAWVRSAVDDWKDRFPLATPSKQQRATDFLTAITSDEASRRRSIGLPEYDEISSEIITLEAPKLPTREELVASVEAGQLVVGELSVGEMLSAIAEGGIGYELLRHRKLELDRQFFAIPDTGTTLVKEVQEIAMEALVRFQIPRSDSAFGVLYAASAVAAARYFGFPNIQKATIEKHEPFLVHAARDAKRRSILRGLILALFLGRMERKNPSVGAELRSVYDNEVRAVRLFVGDEDDAAEAA